MADLETACRELVAEWRNNSYPTDRRKDMPYRTGVGRGYNRASNDLIEAVEYHANVDPEVKTLVAQMEDAT